MFSVRRQHYSGISSSPSLSPASHHARVLYRGRDGAVGVRPGGRQPVLRARLHGHGGQLRDRGLRQHVPEGPVRGVHRRDVQQYDGACSIRSLPMLQKVAGLSGCLDVTAAVCCIHRGPCRCLSSSATTRAPRLPSEPGFTLKLMSLACRSGIQDRHFVLLARLACWKPRALHPISNTSTLGSRRGDRRLRSISDCWGRSSVQWCA